MGILSVFRRMERNRRLYIGNDGILAMQHIVFGYGLCQDDFGIHKDEEFERFVHFAHDALNVQWGAFSIWRIIDNKTSSDDEAFDLFFSLLHRFDEREKNDGK